MQTSTSTLAERAQIHHALRSHLFNMVTFKNRGKDPVSAYPIRHPTTDPVPLTRQVRRARARRAEKDARSAMMRRRQAARRAARRGKGEGSK